MVVVSSLEWLTGWTERRTAIRAGSIDSQTPFSCCETWALLDFAWP